MFIKFLRVLKISFLWLFPEGLTEAFDFVFAVLPLLSVFVLVFSLWLREKTLLLNKNKGLSHVHDSGLYVFLRSRL